MRRDRERRAGLVAGLVLAGFFASSWTSRADDPPATYTLAVQRVQGTVWKVEQTLELSSKNKGTTTFAGGMGTAQTLVKGDVELTEKWTDTCTNVTDGTVTEMKRVMAASKMKPQKGPATATSFHGGTLHFRWKDGVLTVEPSKCTLPDLAKTLLERGPVDPVEVLLPKAPVAVGQEWKIAVEDLMCFQRLICLGATGARGEARQNISLLLESFADESPASAAKIIVGHIESVKGTTATLVFVDDKSTDDLSAQGHKGPLFNQPPVKTVIEGTLTFDLEKGRPLHLTWSQVHDQADAEPGPNVPVKVPGFIETWKLEKTWK